MPCPRWDSNGIPSPVITGKSRKHAESGPIRWAYEPVRGGKCGHCAHFLFGSMDHRQREPDLSLRTHIPRLQWAAAALQIVGSMTPLSPREASGQDEAPPSNAWLPPGR